MNLHRPSSILPGLALFLGAIGTVFVSPCSAAEVERQGPVSFQEEVIPLFTRMGCNQGACHGKQAGQNGFRLSLRGYAPELDYQWTTREFTGRRISVPVPDDSLLLRKPLGQAPHAGGRLFTPGSRAHRLLRDWIAGGAPGPVADEPRAVKLEVAAGSGPLKVGQQQQIVVQARYSDGTLRDVTWLSKFVSNDEGLLDVSTDGLATALRNGETAVRVHFQQLVEAVIFSVPYETITPPELFARKNNAIDELVFGKLAQLHIPPADLCDDARFLRRAMLDTIGTLPTPAEVRSFLADASSDKRARLVEVLLSRPEFVDYWTLQWCDVFQNRKERDHDVRGTKGVRSFYAWLRTQVAANRPWNQLATDIITATGDSTARPQIGYYIVTVGENRDAARSEVVDSVAQAFLGTRIGCARCHNHPLERYTQDDYYHFAGFFSRVSLRRQESQKGPTSLVVGTEEQEQISREITQADQQLAEARTAVAGKTGDDEKNAERRVAELEQHRKNLDKRLDDARKKPIGVVQPRTGQFVAARPLDRTTIEFDTAGDPRTALAAWVTRPDNEYFSGSFVNRVWKHFFGVGLVEPVDDLRASNPPTNPELWKLLNREFVEHGFDTRHVMRLILNSRTYQLDSATQPANEKETHFFSHYYPRRLPAEVLLDAISQATGVPEPFPGYPLGLRAIQLPDPSINSYFLGLFGRPDRVTACACERNGEVTLPQLLHMQNGDLVPRKVLSADCRLKLILKNEPDDKKVFEELCFLTFSRLPTADEEVKVLEFCSKSSNREKAFQDVLWALLNTKTFAFNY